MALVKIGPAGGIGINKDLSAHALPAHAWTDAQNVRFLDGMAMQHGGHGEVYAGAVTIPLHVMPVNVGSARHWLYAGANKVYDVTSASGSVVHTNITRQTAGVDVDYSAQPNTWTSTSLSGIPILNNPADLPQQWGLSGRLTNLTAWDSNWRAKSIRAYKNQLVALNITKSGTNYPFMVKWSHPADPGAVPASWDATDPTKDAGEVDLAEGGDPIVDGMQLGGTFVIYKQNSTWRMDYTGGPFVNAFTKVGGISGAMNVNCIVEVEINGVSCHVVLTRSDVVVHDGQTATSVLDKAMRRTLFALIDGERFDRCFVSKNPFLNEVLVCFPEGGETVCTRALVWNYQDRTCSFRQLPNLHHAAYGPVEQGLGQPWDGDGSPWYSDITRWNSSEFNPDTVRVLMASNDQKLFLLDSSTTFDGQSVDSYMERRGLAFGGDDQRSLVKSIRPRIFGATGETMLVYVGSQTDPYADPVYGDPQAFTIGVTERCDFLVDSRYHAVKFARGDAFQYRLDNFDVEVEKSGGW